MLRKLQNTYEMVTHDLVHKVSDKYGAKAYPKVRVADVFVIEGSGISKELYSYSLMAHFDTIVCDEDSLPLFAIEFDGSRHEFDREQIERDMKKNALCETFKLPLLRITSDFLFKQYRGMNLLSWFIEVWFAAQWFYKAQEEGELAYDEPFMPMSFINIPGLENDYPLWLSRNARGKFAALCMKGVVKSYTPTTTVWTDQNNDYHCLSWVIIDEQRAVYVINKMRGQQFPVPISDLLEDVTVVELKEKLVNILDGIEDHQEISSLNEEIVKYKSHYRLVSGGGQLHEKIESFSK